MKKLLVAGLLAICFNTYSASTEPQFSSYQIDNLHFAYQFGEQFSKDGKFKEPSKRYDNHGLGYIMAGLVWQESSAGTILKGKNGHKAYGMFQNYLPTLRARVDQLGWKMTDRQIINSVKKRENSATWAYVELSYWLNVHNGDVRKALSSYNAGWNIKAGNRYATDVLAKANYLKSNKMLHITVD